jgi:predicted ATPase
LLNAPDVRLITILAPGGMGKTRLSVAAAEGVLPDFADGVYFVELAPLTEAESIVSAIAEATGYPFQSDGRSPQQQVSDFLSNKSLLLVLDNYEHLLKGAGLITELLNAAPQLKILVTSRQRLAQSGETLFHLTGMDFPAWETPEDALNYAAVKLFMNSARRAKPDFKLTRDNLNYVARICRMVQGMPLGIVLAASWLGMLTPEEIAAEMAQSRDFLATDEGDLPERQRSIRAVMDYSWQQMNADEQQVFMKLSVFRGGFTREAAEAVAGANLRILMSLTTKSLVRRNAESGRYEIHELLRQYGEDALLSSGKTDVYLIHADFFLSVARRTEPELMTASQLHGFQVLDEDKQNIAAAMNWAHTSGHRKMLCEFVILLHWYWIVRSHLDVVSHWAELISQIDDDFEPEFQAKLYFIRGVIPMAMWHITPDVAQQLDKALTIYREREDQHGIATVLLYKLGIAARPSIAELEELVSRWEKLDDNVGLSMALAIYGIRLAHRGHYDRARSVSLRALELSQVIGDRVRISSVLSDLGNVAFSLGEHDVAMSYFNQALKPAQELQDKYLVARLMRLMGNVATQMGDFAEADNYYQDGLKIFEEIGSRIGAAWILLRWAVLTFKQEQYPLTQLRLCQSLRLMMALNDTAGIVDNVEQLARLSAVTGRHEQAVRAFGCAAKTREASGIIAFEWDQKEIDNNLHYLTQELNTDHFNTEWERGKSLDLKTVAQELLTDFEADTA